MAWGTIRKKIHALLPVEGGGDPSYHFRELLTSTGLLMEGHYTQNPVKEIAFSAQTLPNRSKKDVTGRHKTTRTRADSFFGQLSEKPHVYWGFARKSERAGTGATVR
jgi:hypothetical protein